MKNEYLNKSIRHIALYRTDKTFVGDHLIAGALVRDRDVYTYMVRYFKSNWLQIQQCYLSDLNYKHKNIVH